LRPWTQLNQSANRWITPFMNSPKSYIRATYAA
jgi:hypothetical protein